MIVSVVIHLIELLNEKVGIIQFMTPLIIEAFVFFINFQIWFSLKFCISMDLGIISSQVKQIHLFIVCSITFLFVWNLISFRFLLDFENVIRSLRF